MLLNYIDEKLKAYFKVSSEDRRALLDERLFDDNPLTCDERYLPFFALEVGCEIDDLNIDKQREAIVNAINELKRAGTVSYLRNNLKADIKNEVVELDNFHFRVDLIPEDANERFDDRRFNSIKKRVERFKNVRSVFDGVRFKLFFDESVNVSGASVVKPKIDKDAIYESRSKTDINIATAGVVKPKIDKDVKVKKTYINNVYTNSALNTKIELKQDAKVEDAYIYNVYTNSASSFKTEINREKNLEFNIENSINHYQFLNFNPTLQKEKNLELSFKKSIFNFEFSIFNLTLQKEVTIETTLNSINQIQGAVVWQV